MNKEFLANLLDGRQHYDELTSEEAEQARGAGLVVIFGTSTDRMVLRGAMHEEVICGQDQEVSIAAGRSIRALWNTEGYEWYYQTDIPHASFNVMAGPDTYCRGIVLSTNDL